MQATMGKEYYFTPPHRTTMQTDGIYTLA